MLHTHVRGGRTARLSLLPTLIVPAALCLDIVPTMVSAQSSGGYVSPYQQGPTRPFDGTPRSGVYSAQPAPSYEQTRRGLGTAQPEPGYQPPIWNGLYLGLQAGYGWQSTRFEAAGLPELSQANSRLGGHVGYNWQFNNNFVLGIEGDVTRVGGSTASSTNTASALMEAGWESTLRARAGVSVGRTLIYGTAGFAFNDQKVSVSTSTLSTSDLRFGSVAGGGVEMMLAPNISTRIEALHYGFSDSSANATLGAVKQTDNVLRAGLSFKLN